MMTSVERPTATSALLVPRRRASRRVAGAEEGLGSPCPGDGVTEGAGQAYRLPCLQADLRRGV